MELTPQLRAHIERVMPDMLASALPGMTAERAWECVAGAEKVLPYEQWQSMKNPATTLAHALIEPSPFGEHRRSVSVAVEAHLRGHGLGGRLLRQACEYADRRKIEWLDGVLWEHNGTALKMDLAAGFRVVGRIADAYRVDGEPRALLFVTRRRGA